MEVDVVMWAKNSAEYLHEVLPRIKEVVPGDCVHRYILVDDHSDDNTREVAREHGWEVYLNRGRGIPWAVETALGQVDCEYFVSVEHDILLAENWWSAVTPKILEEDVACAQGVRLSLDPALRAIEEYMYERQGFFYVSFDNNIFKTDIIRKIGVPKDCPICTDTILFKKLRKLGYRWIIVPEAVSLHISRVSLRKYLKHTYEMSMRCAHTPYCTSTTPLLTLLRIFLTSPIRALDIALKKKCPKVLYAYPAVRWYKLKACLDWKRKCCSQ